MQNVGGKTCWKATTWGTRRRKDNIEIAQGNGFHISGVELHRVVKKHKRVDS
jgi:hypothetical protein